MPSDNPPTAKVDPRPRSAASRFKAVACLGGVSLERGVEDAEIREYIRDPANVVWVDVEDPGPDELSALMEDFAFHPLAMEDVAKGDQRPKVDEYKGYLFVVTYTVLPGDTATDFRATEVNLFIGRNYVVSIHRQHVPALEDAMGRWSRGGEMLREGVGFLVYTVMDAMIDAYFPLIDGIEDQMDKSEDEIFSRGREGGVENLLKLKRTLVRLRRVLYPMREAFHVFLRRDQPLFAPSTHVYFQDVYDHVLRILDALDMERDMVTAALDAHLTVVSNRLNATMKTLTVITVIVAIAGSIFSAWGMNVEGLPLKESSWGFWGVMGGTAALSLAAWQLSRMRGWI